MRWRAAVKLAYEGKDFLGFQRQPHARTVEDAAIAALVEIEAIDDALSSRFKGASRTDAGVSALGNVVAFDTDFRKGKLVHALNAVSDGIYFYGVAEVPESFSPRRASQRWYRYFLPSKGLNVHLVEESAGMFLGKHDFKCFCKVDERGTVKVVQSVDVFPLADFLIVDIRAREFLRNMVRRMVAAMDAVGKGKATVDDVRGALEGKRCQFGLAKPERLCLMDVTYPFEFELSCPATLRRRLEERRRSNFIELAFYDHLDCESNRPTSK
ncbi:MAG: tRNA pseudouridine(38-40) synthase TruA [Methanomassiliicoccales archaeon]|nr:tRNA pseudouridine(38-40) synthase TruA [Methanomassiliicoccales archaeon]